MKDVSQIKLFDYLFIGDKGRINRSIYITGLLLISCLASIAFFVLDYVDYFFLTGKLQGFVYAFSTFVAYVLLFVLKYNLTLKRAYDIKKGKKVAIFVSICDTIFFLSASIIFMFSAFLSFNFMTGGLAVVISFLVVLLVAIIYLYYSIVLVLRGSREDNDNGTIPKENPLLQPYSKVSVIVVSFIAFIFISFVTQAYNPKVECINNWHHEIDDNYSSLTTAQRKSKALIYVNTNCRGNISVRDFLFEGIKHEKVQPMPKPESIV